LVVIKGTLIEDKTLIPVKNQQIGLTINGQPLGDKLTTNQDGVFTLEHKFTKSGNYQIEASFAGDPTYWETSAKAKLEVTASSQRIPIWIFAVIAVAIGLIIATGFALVRRRKRRTLVTEQSDIQPTTILKVVPIKEKPHGISLNIEFPLINGVFPDVWGIGDELEIFCVLLDPNRNAMDTSVWKSISAVKCWKLSQIRAELLNYDIRLNKKENISSKPNLAERQEVKISRVNACCALLITAKRL